MKKQEAYGSLLLCLQTDQSATLTTLRAGVPGSRAPRSRYLSPLSRHIRDASAQTTTDDERDALRLAAETLERLAVMGWDVKQLARPVRS